eukprot:scaffold30768_cov68-Phaeocystis_antarctica.AAC.4
MVKGAPEAVGRPLPGSAELSRAARRDLRRHMSRAGALPTEHFDHAAVPSRTLEVDQPSACAVQ